MAKMDEPTTQSRYDDDTAKSQILNNGVMVLDNAKFPALSQRDDREQKHKVQEEGQNTESEQKTKQMKKRRTKQRTNKHVIDNIASKNRNDEAAPGNSTKSEGKDSLYRLMTLTESMNGNTTDFRDAMKDSYVSHQNQDPALDDNDDEPHNDRQHLLERQQPSPPIEDQSKKQNEIVHENIRNLLQHYRIDEEVMIESTKNRRGSISSEAGLAKTTTFNSEQNYTTDAYAPEIESNSSSSSTSTEEDDDSRKNDDRDNNNESDSFGSDDDNDDESSFFSSPPQVEKHQTRKLVNFKIEEHDTKVTQQISNDQNSQSDDDSISIDSGHQILFDNLESSIDTLNVTENNHVVIGGSEREGSSLLSPFIDIRELTKLCFAAMSIVFSSKRTFCDNKSNEDVFDNKILNESEQDDNTSLSPRDSSDSDESSSTYSEDDNSITEENSTDSNNRPLIPLCVVSMLWKELLQRRCRRNRFYGEENYNDDETEDNNSDENDENDENEANEEKEENEREDNTIDGILFSEENVSTVLDKVSYALVNELSFLDMIALPRTLGSDQNNCDDSNSGSGLPLTCQVVHIKQFKRSQEQDSSDRERNMDSSIATDEESNNWYPEEVDGNVSHNNANGSIKTNEALSQHDSNEYECIKVNHDVHILYGRHAAKKFAKKFTFRHKKYGSPSKYRYSTGPFDEDPDVAMNAIMASACSTCIENANQILLKGRNLPPALRLQYEYSMEMLPWHLMQSLQYKYVVDVLTDEKFVSRRIELMEFHAATKAHILDLEDLFSRTAIGSTTATLLEGSSHLKFADVNMSEIFMDSFRLFGDTIQREEAKRLREPIKEEVGNRKGRINNETGEKTGEEKENEFNITGLNITVTKEKYIETAEMKYILEISLALQSMGDSLFMQGLKSEAMAYFYRALVRYEHTNEICAKDKDTRTKSCARSNFDGALDGLEDSTLENSTQASDAMFDNNNVENETKLLMGSIQFFMGEILSRIASVYQSMSSTPKVDAMLCYDRALSFYSRRSSVQHMEGVAKTLSAIGQIHLDNNEYEAAHSCFDESLLLLRALQDDTGNDTTKNANEIACILAFMGTIQKERGMPNEALDYFSQALYEKVVVSGQFHSEVGFLQLSIAKIYSEINEFTKALTHFEESLRIRRVHLKLAQSDESSLPIVQGSGRKDMVKSNELLVAETLLCIGTVYEACEDYDNAFTNLLENASIHRSYLVNLAGGQGGLLMINDIVKFMQDSDSIDIISNVLNNLIIALGVGNQIIDQSIDEIDDKAEYLFEIKGQVAELEFFTGMIYGARYFYNMNRGNRGRTNVAEEAEADAERAKAKDHLKKSISLRKNRVGVIDDVIKPGDTNDHEEIVFILYELGKLFSFSALKENRSTPRPRAYASLFFSKKNLSEKDGTEALSYFEEARSILKKNPEPFDAVDSLILVDNPRSARLQKTPIIYEEMLQTMAMLYRKFDEDEKSVECYNEVSILLTRIGLGDNPNVGLNESNVDNQKEKVAIASLSIGDILSDTGEYENALKSYDEALQLRRFLDKDSLDVADTLCRKGMVFLKLKEWGHAVLTFDEALRLRVDRLPEDHQDIAACFHQIGKGYEGHEKYEQALDYYKKGQRILSRHSTLKDLQAADLLYDLGSIVLLICNLSECMVCTAPSDDDVSLALKCLTQSCEIYMEHFGNTALEVGNNLSLLGEIHAKFGDHVKAIETYEDSLSIFRNVPQDQSLRIAKTLNLLSLSMIKAEEDNNANDKSLQYLQLAQQIYEDKKETSCEEYLDVLFNLGAAYFKQDAIVEAISSYEDALTVACVALGRDHIRISVILEKLGSCLIRTREHTEAMDFLEEGLEVRKKHAMCNDLIAADIHFAMGIIHCESGNLDEAIDSYEEALKIRRIQLGDNHVEVAQILNNIGSVFARNGEYQRALKPWQNALEMYRLSGLEDDHPKIVITLGNIELSKNLVSLKRQSGLKFSVRKVGSW